MRDLSGVRYLAAVSPPATSLIAVLAILPLAAIGLEFASPASSDWVLASIALVQLFACSTGFTKHATRGYYDPVLLGGPRIAVAAAHFAVSAAPGALAWMACGTAQAVAARSLAVPGFRPAGWIALLLVSAIPWAASVRAAPFLGGALWLLLSVSLVISGKVLGPLGLIHVRAAWAREHPMGAFGLALAFPFAIPSIEWPPAILLGLAGSAVLALAGGAALIARADLGLAEEGT
jgi:hypothetical protein